MGTAGLGTDRLVPTELAARFGRGARLIAELRAVSDNPCLGCRSCEASLAGRKHRTHAGETAGRHDRPMSDPDGAYAVGRREREQSTQDKHSLDPAKRRR